MHRPTTIAEAEAADADSRSTSCSLQLMLARARHIARHGQRGTPFELRKTMTTQLREALPWPLTGDQKQAVREISRT